MEPYIPLIKGKVNILLTLLLCLYLIANRSHGLDKVVHIKRAAKILFRIIVTISVVAM